MSDLAFARYIALAARVKPDRAYADRVERKARGTHCARGHVMDEANTIERRDGKVRCRACYNRWARERERKRRAADVATLDA